MRNRDLPHPKPLRFASPWALALVALLASTAAPNASGAQATVTKSNTKVTALQVDKDKIFFQLQIGTTGVNCGSDSWAILAPAAEAPLRLQQFQALQAAYLSGRTVTVYLMGCDSTYPKLNKIQLL